MGAAATSSRRLSWQLSWWSASGWARGGPPDSLSTTFLQLSFSLQPPETLSATSQHSLLHACSLVDRTPCRLHPHAWHYSHGGVARRRAGVVSHAVDHWRTMQRSETLRGELDGEVKTILHKAYDDAAKLLRRHRKTLHALVDLLMERGE